MNVTPLGAKVKSKLSLSNSYFGSGQKSKVYHVHICMRGGENRESHWWGLSTDLQQQYELEKGNRNPKRYNIKAQHRFSNLHSR